jgi:hypothetical protein
MIKRMCTAINEAPKRLQEANDVLAVYKTVVPSLPDLLAPHRVLLAKERMWLINPVRLSIFAFLFARAVCICAAEDVAYQPGALEHLCFPICASCLYLCCWRKRGCGLSTRASFFPVCARCLHLCTQLISVLHDTCRGQECSYFSLNIRESAQSRLLAETAELFFSTNLILNNHRFPSTHLIYKKKSFS